MFISEPLSSKAALDQMRPGKEPMEVGTVAKGSSTFTLRHDTGNRLLLTCGSVAGATSKLVALIKGQLFHNIRGVHESSLHVAPLGIRSCRTFYSDLA